MKCVSLATSKRISSANMVNLQALVSLISIFIALIPLSRCYSIITVTENEAVQIEFPYPCDSNTVTIQSENNDPFYSSTDTANLHLPTYQLHRFSVTDGDCSVQVKINPVNRNDQAIYICIAYKDGVIHGRFTKIELYVNRPPGDVSCTLSISDDAVGDWLPLQCAAPVGSLAGEIYCYQDSKRLPPQSKLVQIGQTLKQTIWVSKEHPVFCCSAFLDRPKERCDCKDFVSDPMGNISHTKIIINPCSQNPEMEFEDTSQLPQLIEPPQNVTITFKYEGNAIVNALLWVGVIILDILITCRVVREVRWYVHDKFLMKIVKCQSSNILQPMKNMEENETLLASLQEKEHCRLVLSSNEHSRKRRKSW